MKKVCVFLADGFETIEGLTTVDVLRRAGVEVDTVSIQETKTVTTSHGISLQADKLFDEVDYTEKDMIVLPGGSVGTENLDGHEGVKEVVRQFIKASKYVAAICAAPSILGKMGYLEGKKAVAHPSMTQFLYGAKVQDDPAVRDGYIITGQAMAASLEFALLILESLEGKAVVDKVCEGIVR